MSNNKLTQAALSGINSRPSVMTHVVLGYPSLAESINIVEAMSAGAAIIELQIPFSDPMADGPTIMHANEHALRQGTTPPQCIEAISELSKRIDTPLLIMSYCNIVFGYKNVGFNQFCIEAAEAGVAGLIVPDVPLEESDEGYWTLSKEHGLSPISLVSPVTDTKRLAHICKEAESFVYCVATTGTTGARETVPTELPKYLANVREQTKLPLAVGFGISTPEQVAALGEYADMAIVGSAMINLIEKAEPQARLKKVSEFTKQLVGG